MSVSGSASNHSASATPLAPIDQRRLFVDPHHIGGLLAIEPSGARRLPASVPYYSDRPSLSVEERLQRHASRMAAQQSRRRSAQPASSAAAAPAAKKVKLGDTVPPESPAPVPPPVANENDSSQINLPAPQSQTPQAAAPDLAASTSSAAQTSLVHDYADSAAPDGSHESFDILESVLPEPPPVNQAEKALRTVIPICDFKTHVELRVYAQRLCMLEPRTPTSSLRNLLSGTIHFAHRAFRSALEDAGGRGIPSVDSLSDADVRLVMYFGLMKTPHDAARAAGPRLAFVSHTMLVLCQFAGDGSQCQCAGQLKYTDCTQFHMGGRCSWKPTLDPASLSLWTIDHDPRKKTALAKRGAGGFWFTKLPSLGYTTEIQTWRWPSPYKCRSCNPSRPIPQTEITDHFGSQ